MTTLVVGRDSNIDVLGGGVGVAEGNHGNVDVGSLLDSLGVGAGIGDNDQAGLLERTGDVVGERTGGEATGDGRSTGVSGELEDSTLTVGTGRDDANVGRVIDGDNDTGSEDDLLPEKLVSKTRYISSPKAMQLFPTQTNDLDAPKIIENNNFATELIHRPWKFAP